MADIIPFPQQSNPQAELLIERQLIGAESGITVRVMEQLGGDLLVVLDGTFEGTATVASVPAGEMAVAEAMAHSILATLEAAEITWSMRRLVLGGG